MHIKLLTSSTRRMAWTDRRNGYFEYEFKNIENNGYWQGSVRYFTDILVDGHSICDSDYVNVYPQGFRAFFDKKILEVSLLLEEQAFYISALQNVGFKDLFYNTVRNDFNPEVDTSNDVKVPHWSLEQIDGIHVLSSDIGFAITGDFNFHYAENPDVLTLFCEEQGLPQEAKFSSKGWYLVFEKDSKTAKEKAVRLAKEKAIESHCKIIEEFLAKCSIESGDKKFDEAFAWARFSGWLLATKDHGSAYRGIWAGLRWFRDNWGRDTFISLCGTLLNSGCFDEAKDVLLGFAGFQDLNKESSSYGRIPNRYRDKNDVIYNTADGTLWFIRGVWEYILYSGDKSILEKLKDTILIALDSDIARCDNNGFLMHGDADTWMDARIENKQSWSPRGNRANDIQALWFTALRIGSFVCSYFSDCENSKKYAQMAAKVKESFNKIFWNKDCNAMADHLPEGGYGEWAKDMRVRPNQLMTITIPSILPQSEENKFVDDNRAKIVIANVERELVNPFGLYSLSPDDPLFHPEHENPNWYHKDAAYHNGTIWEWNTGMYVSSCAIEEKGILKAKPAAILMNEAKMIMEMGCAGSLSENIHARPDSNGSPKLSGTFSQAWSVAEFVRNVIQDLIGFKCNLLEKSLELNPHLPAGCNDFSATLPFGTGDCVFVKIVRSGKEYKCSAILHSKNFKTGLLLNGNALQAEKRLDFSVKIEDSKKNLSGTYEKFGCPKKWIKSPFAQHNLENPWCGSEKKKNYLHDLILSGRMQSKTSGGENTAALEWYFDSQEFKKKYLTNAELGAIYSKRKTVFRLWAPTAKQVVLKLFKDGNKSECFKEVPLHHKTPDGSEGIWETCVKGDLHGIYYLYEVTVHGVQNISSDPYAKASGVNGIRSMVVDLSRTNPQGWENVKLPVVASAADVIAYEVHVADISSGDSWNGSAKIKRTYLAACQKGTAINGIPIGFDHIKSLGITHVQFLPIFDFRSVDESRMNDENYKKKITFGTFNWGYDPENYALPEGSYSTDPYHGEVRIKELKTMIKSFADEGIGVIMDVVYNHVNDGLHQGLGTSVPGYFFRVEGYSGAGEDTASEREMFRKYMVDTLCYWLSEYKLCGFRFDLMGLHDVVTMNKIKESLRKIKKDVLIYGEGWDMYRAKKMISACQSNSEKMPEIGFFNDAMRCGIKGPVFDDKEKGFIHDGSRKEAVKFGIVGATKHHQVEYKKIEGTAAPNPWGKKTWISVNYTEIHDNITLADKIFLVEQDKDEAYYEQMQKMALSLVLLAQGMPIMHAGMEFMRSKEVPSDILAQNPALYDVGYSDDKKRAFMRNSYNACDRINALDWQRCIQKHSVVEYVKNLIALRKSHCAFRIDDEKTLVKALRFIDNKQAGFYEQVLAWEIDGTKCGDSWKKIVIVANPVNSDVKYAIPQEKNWILVTDGCSFSTSQKEFLEQGSVVQLKPKTVAVFAAI